MRAFDTRRATTGWRASIEVNIGREPRVSVGAAPPLADADSTMKRKTLESGALALLGLGIGANAVLGPLVLGVIRFHVSSAMENQLIGGELVSLFLAAPAAILAAVLWWRSHPAAPVIALGASLYALYTYPQYVVGPQYERYAGNSEFFFPLYLTLILLALGVTIVAWSRLGRMKLPELSRPLRAFLSAVLSFVSVAFALAWVGSIAAVLGGSPTIGEYQQDQTLFWLIRLMDLGIVIPVGLLTAIGLMRRASWSSRMAYAVVGFQTLLVSAVASMAVVMSKRDDPGANPVLMGVTLVTSVVLAVIFFRLVQVLMRGERFGNAALRHLVGNLKEA